MTITIKQEKKQGNYTTDIYFSVKKTDAEKDLNVYTRILPSELHTIKDTPFSEAWGNCNTRNIFRAEPWIIPTPLTQTQLDMLTGELISILQKRREKAEQNKQIYFEISTDF